MAERTGKLERRRWADVVVIVVGIFELIIALYGGVLALPGGVATRLEAPGWFFAATATAGVLAIAAVPLALRSASLGRMLSGGAGVVLLGGLLAFEAIDTGAVLTIIVPAALLFAATPFLGRMPTPEEEGERR